MLQVLFGALPPQFHYGLCFDKSNPLLSFKCHMNCRKERSAGLMQQLKFSRTLRCYTRMHARNSIDDVYGGKTVNDHLDCLSCKCQEAESLSEVTAEVGNSILINGASNGPNIKNVEGVQQLQHEIGGSASRVNVATMINNTLGMFSVDSIEDEAWDLLRASIVYYCGNPIGTIAANDPTNSSILNYDQVFIRDFIPSGIAFLLKGEYDIVRNFILYTLQLQHMQENTLSEVSASFLEVAGRLGVN